MAKGKGGFPDFFKKGKKKKGGAPTASDQAEALRMDKDFDKKKKGKGGFVPFGKGKG